MPSDLQAIRHTGPLSGIPCRSNWWVTEFRAVAVSLRSGVLARSGAPESGEEQSREGATSEQKAWGLCPTSSDRGDCKYRVAVAVPAVLPVVLPVVLPALESVAIRWLHPPWP